MGRGETLAAILARILQALALSLALGFILVWLWIGQARVRFPYELEWIENSTLAEALRVADKGQPYAAPSREYVSSVYTPLYTYASAAAMKVAGPGFAGPRAVSFLATVGSLLLIAVAVRRLTGSLFEAILGSGLYAATYVASGAYFDLARVDALAVFLMLLGFHFAIRDRGAASAALSALCFGLSALTKQSMAVAPLCVAVALWWRGRRVFFAFLGTLVALAAVSFVAFETASGGWFHFYTIVVPSAQPILLRRIATFWLRDMLGVVPIALLATLAGFALRPTPEEDSRVRGATGLLAAFCLGALVMSWSTRARPGGDTNTLMPVFAALAIGTAVGIHRALVTVACGEMYLRPVILAAAVFQLTAFIYNYYSTPVLPAAADRRVAEDLISKVGACPGEVWIPSHTWIQQQAGKAPGVFWGALAPVMEAKGRPSGDPLPEDLAEALAARRYALVVLDADESLLNSIVSRNYRLWESDTCVDRHVTSLMRPRRLYVPLAAGRESRPRSRIGQ